MASIKKWENEGHVDRTGFLLEASAASLLTLGVIFFP